jgi:long-chain fatty acid transport protein
MIHNFSLKTLAVAITSLSVASVAGAAGLDRSGQDISAFLQDGLYAEASYTYIDGKVTGYDNSYMGIADLSKYNQGNKIDDIAESYDMARYGVKVDVNDRVSVGILYDEPFGAAAKYTGNNNFSSGNAEQIGIDADKIIADFSDNKLNSVAQAQGAFSNLQTALANPNLTPEQREGLTAQAQDVGKALGAADIISKGRIATIGESTQVEVRSENITGLIGIKLNDNFQVYGGPAIQRLNADVALRGPAYLTTAGYDAHISSGDGYGWVAGAAFSKPEIALKAALTYRSEIDHENNIDETVPGAGLRKGGKIDITTPESVNFDFQTGINPTTLATAKVRFVPWSKFEIVPPLYNSASGLPLVSYDDDQWQVELGLAKRVAPNLAVSGSLGWDSGAGNPTTSLGPIEGYYSVGAGAKFDLDKNWAISAGAKYLMFGDANGSLPNRKVVSNFEDNDGYAVGVKLSYQEK